MKTVNVELGNSGPCCVSETMPEKYYPTVTYTSDEPMNLPESGKMLIEFKKVESSESNRGGKEKYSCTFEVRKIVKVGKSEGDDESNAGKAKNESGDALDKLRDDYVKSKKGY